MAKIRTGQEIATRMMGRSHMVQPAEANLGLGGVSMSGSAAKSGGPSPYYAPGMGLPFDGFSKQEAPQGLGPGGLKEVRGGGKSR
eukprot:10061273-Karenia_brevis.AAC.1